MLWRILYAVLAVTFLWLILPPLLRTLGVSVDGDVFLVIKLCVAALALAYIAFGRTPPPRFQ